MAEATRIRTRRRGARVEVLVLVRHPMSAQGPGQGDEEGRFIERMVFTVDGRLVAVAELGPGVAENPLTEISLSGAQAGARIAVSWTDNRGGSGGAQTVVP